MSKMISAFGAAAIAGIVGLTSVFPASAAPIAPARIHVTSDVDLAQYRHSDDDKPRWKKRHNNRHDRVERRHDRRHYRAERRHDRWNDRAVWRHERRGYWNGHRGYREYRRGYRRHSDGYYYSPEVFQLFFRF
ncbi:hypothetical protein OIU34_03280 [Pararhizobium sp. BT-229]|uniref:hypothetical protein n=1 Tax=Pararhizobium sp. BT-229 TaxID=2986923 RepID=UPI0021F71552|nr:hypothetical protein [Pararhizobium sp. BT-229]MCV9960913.1 hypothetical protein [Pararhizobium sp. BT-229]